MLKRLLLVALVVQATARAATTESPSAKAPASTSDSITTQADTAAEIDPVRQWSFSVESGLLRTVGARSSPIDYKILPQLLTWKTPAVSQRAFAGRDLVMRSRFSVLLEPIVRGPEHYFIGGSASGILEWWNHARTHALFFSSGGGVGWMDSKGHEIAGGQGQDFNFNWFVYAGSTFRRGEKFSASVGAYFQHISNRGLDKINPGIDALGPMVNLGWRF